LLPHRGNRRTRTRTGAALLLRVHVCCNNKPRGSVLTACRSDCEPSAARVDVQAATPTTARLQVPKPSLSATAAMSGRRFSRRAIPRFQLAGAERAPRPARPRRGNRPTERTTGNNEEPRPSHTPCTLSALMAAGMSNCTRLVAIAWPRDFAGTPPQG